jgi:hypothetical protein
VRTKIVTAVTFGAFASVGSLVAQTPGNDRVAKGMPSRFVPPTCGIKAGHFKVQSGATYLKTGIETPVDDNKTRALKNGKKVLLEALEQNQQEKNPGLWYYLGRIYLQEGDIVGADSALTRSETLLPLQEGDQRGTLRRLGASGECGNFVQQGREDRFGSGALPAGQHNLPGQAARLS